MGDDHDWAGFGEAVDALVAADLTARGVCAPLYAAARERTGEPLVLAAATRLRERVRPGDHVLICTGWPCATWLLPDLTETDGPVGAAHLARALEECLGAVPVLVTAPALVPVAAAALRGAGLVVADLHLATRSKSGPRRAAVAGAIGFTTEAGRAAEDAAGLLDRLRPAAVIGIEVPGANHAGDYHDATASRIPCELVVKADALVHAATERGSLTIGIGDGGNELGMGSIADAVRGHLPEGATVAPATEVDALIVGCISNWAAIALSAAISALAGRPDFLSSVDLARIMDRACDAGAIDGPTSYVEARSDGTSLAANLGLVALLDTAVRAHSTGWRMA